MKTYNRSGVTMLELLVVVVIIGILSTIAVGAYAKNVQRSKYVKIRAEIRTLEIAIARYEVDTGALPPSGSGSTFAPSNLSTAGNAEDSGYLVMALKSSLNNNPAAPLSERWVGPYIDWDYNRLGNTNGAPITTSAGASTAVGEISFLDPFGLPYQYIRSTDYASRGGTRLPSGNPYAATEIYFNPSTYQIFSFGADGVTTASPERGLGGDDVTNFTAAAGE